MAALPASERGRWPATVAPVRAVAGATQMDTWPHQARVISLRHEIALAFSVSASTLVGAVHRGRTTCVLALLGPEVAKQRYDDSTDVRGGDPSPDVPELSSLQFQDERPGARRDRGATDEMIASFTRLSWFRHGWWPRARARIATGAENWRLWWQATNPPARARALLLGAWLWFRGLPMAVQATAAGLILLAPVVAIAAHMLASAPDVRFISNATGYLRAGPRSDGAYPVIEVLERGERVEVIRIDEPYALVQDSTGQVGYLPLHELSNEAPAVSPAQEFTRCKKRRAEADGSACEARAEEQFVACGRSCASDKDCADHCRQRKTTCVAVCQAGLDGGDAVSTADAAPDASVSGKTAPVRKPKRRSSRHRRSRKR